MHKASQASTEFEEVERTVNDESSSVRMDEDVRQPSPQIVPCQTQPRSGLQVSAEVKWWHCAMNGDFDGGKELGVKEGETEGNTRRQIPRLWD